MVWSVEQGTVYLLVLASVVLLSPVKHGETSILCSAANALAGPGRGNTGNKFSDTPRHHRQKSPHEKSRTRRDDSERRHAHGEHLRAGRLLAEERLQEDDPPAAPEQVHISLAVPGSTDEYAVTVAWSTWPETESHVLWGETQDQLDTLVEGNATFYSARHPGRADYKSGFLHSATIPTLRPSTTYYYACGDERLAMSSVRSFVTPPKVGEQTITLGILGDLGQTDDSRATLDAIDRDASLDLVLHAGDLSYADCDQPRWDSFMRMLDPVASRLPWMVAAGNHEIEAGSTGGKPFVAYEHRFRMPAARAPVQGFDCGSGGGLDGRASDKCGEGQGPVAAEEAATAESKRLTAVGGGPAGKAVGAAVRDAARSVREALSVINVEQAPDEQEQESTSLSCCPSEWSGTYDYGNSFYSFDVGPVHVVTLNPYTATGEDSEQYSWLTKDLEAVDRTLTPWIVVMMHCPWYNSNLAHQGERQAETAMHAMEPLLHEHKVAVIVAGHVHAYERTHPVFDFDITDNGPIHLVVGGAGNREGHAADFYPSPEWSAFRNGNVFGSGRLSIQGPSLALWEWLASSEPSGLHDVAWISNPYSPYTPGEERSNLARVRPMAEEQGERGAISANRRGGVAELRSRFSR